MIASTFWKKTIHGAISCDQLTRLGLFLVLLEVACSVEELLGKYRGEDPHLAEWRARPVGSCGKSQAGVAHLEQRAHIGHVESDHRVVDDNSRPCNAVCVLERRELHSLTPQKRAAVRAYEVAMFTRESMGTLSPSGPGRAPEMGP